MKVNVIRADNPDMVMKMSLGGFHNDSTINYFRENYNNFTERLGERANAFVNTVKNVYSYVSNVNVIDSAKRALTRVDSVINDKIIYPVNHENIFRPGLVMRRYIMAKPKLYRRYSDNLCSGYEDEWENHEQEYKPEWRDDYLKSIDGVVGDEKTIFITEENHLSSRERFVIQNAWDTVSNLIACGIDPTDFEKGEI